MLNTEKLETLLAESKQEFETLQREANARLTWLDGRIKTLEALIAEGETKIPEPEPVVE